jgi:drug/metabolite transporter (DMT)-like permease
VAVLWALAAAFGFGVADFLARESSRREGSLKTLFYVQFVGSPLAILLVASHSGTNWADIFSITGLLAFLISLEISVGNVLLYRALVKGPLLIVAPITSSFAVVTATLALLSGERPMTIQIVGMAVTIGGVILTTVVSSGSDLRGQDEYSASVKNWTSTGVASAIGAALLFGFGIWALGRVAPVLGSHSTVFVMRVAALAFFTMVLIAMKRPVQLQSNSSFRWILPLGALDTLALWFLNQGLLTGFTSVVSVITSLYSTVTIVLGYVLIGERITKLQQIGIVSTLTGVVLVSV